MRDDDERDRDDRQGAGAHEESDGMAKGVCSHREHHPRVA